MFCILSYRIQKAIGWNEQQQSKMLFNTMYILRRIPLRQCMSSHLNDNMRP